jgi:N-acyl-D-aspartate/D-glutamate deacylase
MSADLVVRGAHVVDGTGAPGYAGDVAVKDGRIVEIGRLGGHAAATVIDADHRVLAPGFIDVHTHYDAQLMFEPTATPSCWHGITTVVIGNCGFSLAPSKPEDMNWLLHSLARVEGMSPASLEAGVTFGGGSMADFIGHLDGRIGVNAVSLVGHSALRRYVMGDGASVGPADPAQIAAMQELLDRALADGGYGFSTSQLDVHADHDGRPVPSNLATPEELVALARVVGRHPHAVMEFAPRTSLPGYSDEDRRLLEDMARVSGAPLNVNMIDWFPGFTEGWATNLAAAEEANRNGLRIIPMLRANPQDFFFNLADTFIFDDVPAMRDALVLEPGARDAALRDPARRDRIRADLATVRRSVDFPWETVTIGATHAAANHHLVGRAVTAIAAERGGDALDIVLDVALADGLATVFRIDRSQGPAHLALRKQLAQHPLLMAGSSDAGAHLQTFCGADYPTRMLTELVPDPLTVEQAVQMLSGRPAAMLSLHDRGVIRPGAVADLVLFDPATVGNGATHFVADLPTGAARLVHEARGYAAVVVDGQVLLRDGVPTGALPGRILRRPAVAR